MFMKKILISTLLSATMFASCVKETVKEVYTPESVIPSIFSTAETLSFEFSAMTSDTTIMVSSNVWWSVQSADNVPWCSYTVSGVQIGFTPIDLAMEPNITDQDRLFNITLKAVDPLDYTETFVITQKCASEKFALSKEIQRRIDPAINAVMMPKYEDALPFDMTTNAAWKIVTTANWCTVTGSDTGQPGINIPVEILCESNPTNDYREATVSIMTGDNVVLMTFKIVQSNDFSAPVLTVTNNEQKLSASWSSTDGVSGYGVVLYDSLGVELIQVSLASSVLELDMTDFAAATGLTNYVGQISVAVRALTPDPAFYAESDPVLSNSHFAGNGGNGMNPAGRFLISNDRHLNNVSAASSKGFFYYLLGIDIDLTGKPLPSIGTATSPFVGDFDGGGKTIRNSAYEPATIDGQTFINYGMFAVAANQGANVSKIANIHFNNCVLNLPAFSASNRCWAMCVGLNNGATISNIHATECKIAFNAKPTAGASANESIGMIVGLQSQGRITNCTTTGGEIGRNETATDTYHQVGVSIGGIAGQITGTVTSPVVVDSCANISTLIRSYRVGGGVIGTSGDEARITRCYNKANVTAALSVGGVIGAVTSSDNSATLVYNQLVERCWNSGTVAYLSTTSAGAPRVGGIIGDSQVGFVLTMKQCFNAGNIDFITATNTAVLGNATDVGGLGGILVQAGGTNTKCIISDCYNKGNVTFRVEGLTGAQTFSSQNGGVGGIAGWVGGNGPTDRGSIQNVYNAGRIEVSLPGANATINCLGNLLGRCNHTQAQFPLSNAVYIANAFAQDTPVAGGVWLGTGNNLATFTTGFYNFTTLASQATFEALNDNGQSFDFTNVWEMKPGAYPILRALYGDPVQ